MIMKLHILFFISFFLTSCNFNNTYENRESDKQEAQKVVDSFYSLIKQNNREEMSKLFGNNFFKVTHKDKLYQVIDKTENEYGEIQSDSLNSWRTFVSKGTNSFSEYELTYDVNRNYGKTKEIISLKKENDTIKITGYRIDFDIVPNK
ncbi:hypothetical protein SAMN02787074_0757 [Chryseobacterium sp. YR221]|nr:hypothetical protein SAMN02787074_0757 [Chryseobacterium sp. YR221]